jgi:hypothetical protein
MDSSKSPLSTDEEAKQLTLDDSRLGTKARIIIVLEIIAGIILALEIIAVPFMRWFLGYAIRTESMTLSPLQGIIGVLLALLYCNLIPFLVFVSMVILSINIGLKRRLGCLGVLIIVCNVVVSIFYCSMGILMFGL